MNQTIRSTIQLLRFHFSFFLMPVYFFALSQLQEIDRANALLIFIILHLLVYPSSNGYNSYMDRDTSPIGGLENPMQPTRQLLYVTIIMDMLAIGMGVLITPVFAAGIFLYITASRAYSSRGVRLKKYPFAGYFTVIFFQGAVTFFLVYHGSNPGHSLHVPVVAMIAASLLIGGFYPLTQIYQHEADLADGVTTISYVLGYKGTFLFTGIIYALAFGMLALQFFLNLEIINFFIIQASLLPVIIYYGIWFYQVAKNKKAANFKNTMRMNLLASVCTNIGFIILIILHSFE